MERISVTEGKILIKLKMARNIRPRGSSTLFDKWKTQMCNKIPEEEKRALSKQF